MIWIFLTVFILLLILIILPLFAKIQIKCALFMNQKQQIMTVTVYFYRLKLVKKYIDLSDETDEDKSIHEALEFSQWISDNFIQKIKDMNDVVTLLFKRIYFHQICWDTQVGTGDASSAGLVSGGIWATKGMIVGLLAVKSNVKCEPDLSVTPLFNQRHFQSEFDCIASVRLGQAMYALLKVIRKFPIKKEAII